MSYPVPYTPSEGGDSLAPVHLLGLYNDGHWEARRRLVATEVSSR